MKFCIVGTGRSGTTLLRRMLNAHPEVFVFDETHWLPALFEQFGACPVETAQLLDMVQRTRHVTGEAVFALDPGWSDELPRIMSVASFQDALGGHCAGKRGKAVWGDKTPDYGFFTSQLQRYWPGCKVIHVLRDGPATALSMSRHPGYRALVALKLQNWTRVATDFTPPAEGFPEASLKSCIDLWYHRLMRILDESRHLEPGSYLELRFEALLREPAEQLRTTAGFLGLSRDPDWLAEASGLVDPKRRARTLEARPEGLLAHFDPQQRQLLLDLGYGSGPATGKA